MGVFCKKWKIEGVFFCKKRWKMGVCCKKWTFPQRRVHYVQYQYFLFYILLIWGCVRTQRIPPPTGLPNRNVPSQYHLTLITQTQRLALKLALSSITQS